MSNPVEQMKPRIAAAPDITRTAASFIRVLSENTAPHPRNLAHFNYGRLLGARLGSLGEGAKVSNRVGYQSGLVFRSLAQADRPAHAAADASPYRTDRTG